jgi:hypothetical protein
MLLSVSVEMMFLNHLKMDSNREEGVASTSFAAQSTTMEAIKSHRCNQNGFGLIKMVVLDVSHQVRYTL